MGANERLPLHRKVERAITLYLQEMQRRRRLGGVNIAEGHTADEPEVPWLCVYARNPRPVEEMPPETRIKSVELVLHQRTHSDDEARSDADRRLQEIDAVFASPECMLAALNKPAGRPDRRPVKELHIYAIHEGEQPEESEGETWNDQKVYEVICQDWDPDIA